MMRHFGILSLFACLAAASGCNLCCWGKRNSELTGPTDIRKSQAWCMGEDAIFHQPMGPSRDNYGMKPTSWREWGAGGSTCADGNCGPTLNAVHHSHQLEPTPQWIETPPDNIVPETNPFHDDSQFLPPPTQGGARRNSLKMPQSSLASPQQKVGTQRGIAGPRNMPIAPLRRSSLNNVGSPPVLQPSLPPRVVSVSAVPTSPSAIMRQAVPAAPTANSQRLQIAVSEAVDTPARRLAPIAAPQDSTTSSSADSVLSSKSKATLASLDRMIDMPPPTSSDAGPGPSVIRNDYAAQPESFRLATRSTAAPTTQDPELAKKTLSALGDMMADNASANEGK